MLRILFGMILAILLGVAGIGAWCYFGQPPVAVADPPIPHEREIADFPLYARIDREQIAKPPVEVDEASLTAGAHIYREQCADCHGFHKKPSSFGPHMYPAAPQLWEKHENSSVVGVSDDPPGETYWKVANGIRLTGMPAYKNVLTDTEMWDVSLLLANADKPLPPAAVDILKNVPPPAAPAADAAPGKPERKK
jgi:mono/diheme cytochrome c family protein